MRIITRTEEDELLSERLGTRFFDLSDAYFDGVPLPRTIRTRTWIPEGTVHRANLVHRHGQYPLLRGPSELHRQGRQSSHHVGCRC
jgi:hypothetical protein